MAAELQATQEAAAALDTLRADPSRPKLLAAVERALARLEDDLGQEANRKIRFSVPFMWGIKIRGEEDWIILWETDPEDTLVVIVKYIGPASFL
ncbi:MAG: hypothetical protein AB1679_35920 [Actinomycetota bacterium]